MNKVCVLRELSVILHADRLMVRIIYNHENHVEEHDGGEDGW